MKIKEQLTKLLNSDLAVQSFTYTFFNVLTAAVPFLLLPFLTNYLTPASYGILAMFTILIGLTKPFVGLNTIGAISRNYFKQDVVQFNQYIANCILILLGSAGIVFLVFLLFGNFISTYSKVPYPFLFVVLLVAISQFLVRILLTLWQLSSKPKKYGFYQLGLTLVDFLLTIILIYFFLYQWEGRVFGKAFAWLSFAVVAYFILAREIKLDFSINKAYLKNALSFGLPLIPHTLGGMALTMTDRLFITNLIDIDTTGIYSVAYQFGSILLILTTSFNTAYVPWLYKKLSIGDQATKMQVVNLTRYYILGVLGVTLVLYFTCLFILPFFVGSEFQGASNYLLWILLGFAFNGMYLMVTNFIFFVEKTYLLPFITFGSILINVPLNYILILKNGALGAAQATTIIYFLIFIATWFLSNKVYRLPWFQFAEKH